MGANTPVLDPPAKKEYLEKHLFNELRWMLGAATEWSVEEQLNLEICGYDVIVYTMDSVFLHARTLFEFFVKATNGNHYGVNAFLGGEDVLDSDKYTKWAVPLHRHLMHAQIRSQPEQLESLSGEMKDLNKMPVDFALEILRLWKEFENLLGSSSRPEEDRELGLLAQQKRKGAIDGAKCVIDSAVARLHAEIKHIQLKPQFTFQ